MKSVLRIAAILTFLIPCTLAYSQTPTQVTLCSLKKDPAAFNHKLIQLTTFLSQGSEDFTLFDPTCSDWPGIWVEYGGRASSGTTYCCGVTSNREREKPLVVEEIPILLVDDDFFRAFDKRIHAPVRESAVIHATVIGRFFAGRLEKFGNGPAEWRGFGHMGCCSLLVIQQVNEFDEE